MYTEERIRDEFDKFADTIRKSLQLVNELSKQVILMADKVSALTERVDELEQRMRRSKK